METGGGITIIINISMMNDQCNYDSQTPLFTLPLHGSNLNSCPLGDRSAGANPFPSSNLEDYVRTITSVKHRRI